VGIRADFWVWVSGPSRRVDQVPATVPRGCWCTIRWRQKIIGRRGRLASFEGRLVLFATNVSARLSSVESGMLDLRAELRSTCNTMIILAAGLWITIIGTQLGLFLGIR
jgi:hypothetical protein